MGKVNEIEGDLIKLAKAGHFDVIGHCTNCFNIQGGGIALPMSRTFHTDRFIKEGKEFEGDINKLGTIDYEDFLLVTNTNGMIVPIMTRFSNANDQNHPILTVVNMYGQFGLGGKFGNSPYGIPFDYDAFRMCLRKINHIFKGKHIGLPKLIGCGLAKGDWEIVLDIIITELKDCDVTLVNFNPNI